MPAKAEKPAPNRLSARPVAYWLVLSQITSTPKTAASRAPAPHAGGKAEPVAAGVDHGGKAGDGGAQHHALGAQVDDAGFLVDQQAQRGDGQHGAGVQRGGEQQGVGFHYFGPPGEFEPVGDQRVAGQQREQQQALEHAGERLGQPQARLRQLAADVEHAHQHRREHHADRVQPADEGHDDGGEAVARRHVGRELADRPGHLQRAGQAGQRRPRSAAPSTARGATRSRRSAPPPAPGRRPAAQSRRGCETGTPTAPPRRPARSAAPMLTREPGDQARDLRRPRRRCRSAGSCSPSGPSRGRRPGRLSTMSAT